MYQETANSDILGFYSNLHINAFHHSYRKVMIVDL